MKYATHVVVDTRDGYTWWRDADGNPFTELTATAWAELVNNDMKPEARTYKVFALVPPPFLLVPRPHLNKKGRELVRRQGWEIKPDPGPVKRVLARLRRVPQS